METHAIQCPYCGQQLDVVIDPSIRSQEYVEDCQVCCRPITLNVRVEHENGAQVDARADAE